LAAVVTEIYRCSVCSCQEILRRSGRAQEEELRALFGAVDSDGSGEVDAGEFVGWLFAPPAQQRAFGETSRERAAFRASVRQQQALRQRFREAAAPRCGELGWDAMFREFDASGDGELDYAEFEAAVRGKCGLSPEAVPPSQIRELFGVIDAVRGQPACSCLILPASRPERTCEAGWLAGWLARVP
jgi:Ca2+-binding EF-hand superfamily protein